ncbi:MAG TPA: bifunctional demethylmenaquinone methyltransferase/2-methoxy-6-polyprenyl-1,4-benzoquinol methylase UbiE [Myxococcales bacterium]|jgi:demethylmenaquinone methyltransferase/2-methoxy-6-polyprenyl-1,4-benzoquinol methylase
MSAPHSAEPEKVQALFTRIAGGYDRFNGIASWGLDRGWRKRAVRLAAIADGARVLDLAAGTGDLTAALAEQAAPALVVSSDFTAAMLVAGKAKLDKLPDAKARQRITFSLADATRLPFADGSFDAVTVSFGLRNFADRPANYREVRRVLKPGGRYVVLELTHPGFAPFKPVYWLYVRKVLPLFGARIAGDRAAYEYLHDSIQAFPDATALAAELAAHGFSKVEFEKLSFGIVAIHVATK